MSSGHRPAGAMLVDTHELVRRAGEMREIHQVVTAPADLGVELIAVRPGSDITLDLRLESVVEGIWVTGTAETELAGECARCLEPVSEQRVFELQELYFYPGQDAEEDSNFVVDDHVDLDPALRDAVVLSLPFRPLCQDDCAGLCSQCGANLNQDPSHSHGEQLDPRWAALQGLASGSSDSASGPPAH